MTKQTEQTDEGLIKQAEEFLDANDWGWKREQLLQLISLIRNHDKQGWVSVDSPPKETGTVILYFKNGDQCFDRYDAERETFDFDEYKEHIENGGGFVTVATHWQPLPSPPEEKA